MLFQRFTQKIRASADQPKFSAEQRIDASLMGENNELVRAVKRAKRGPPCQRFMPGKRMGGAG